MRSGIGFLAAAACALVQSASAAPSVEIASQAGPHGTAPKKWLQRLDEAGAGTTRLVSGGGAEPRLEDLGRSPSGRPLVKVYAVLNRRGELLLPGAEGPQRFTLSDRRGLAEYFERLEAEGETGVTAKRAKYGLTEAEFTDLFTRLSKPLPPLDEGASLGDAVRTASETTRVEIAPTGGARSALGSTAEGATEVAGLSVGTSLALLLRQEGLALAVDKPIGRPTRLRVTPARDADDPWPLGYKPERSPSQTAPVLMEFLTVEVDGYSLQEAIDAIAPRLVHKGRPLPIVWDRFALRRDAIDPATVTVDFPRKRTYYKGLLDKLARQARLGVELRLDEAGAPYLWLTR